MSFLTAIRFLTIFPLGKSNPSSSELGASQSFFPLVGLLLGLILAGVDIVLTHIWPEAVTSALLVAILVVLTRAIHLEGFLDTVDGLLGGFTREHRLKIMQDRHVGAFAVVSAICLLLLKWVGLFSLPAPARFPTLALFPTLSRWGVVLALRAFPYAREEGLGAAFCHQATWPRTLTAALIAVAGSFVLASIGGMVLFIAVSIFVWLLGSLFTRLLGGLTGDTYGALNEIAEVMVLLMAIPLASSGLIRLLPDFIRGIP